MKVTCCLLIKGNLMYVIYNFGFYSLLLFVINVLFKLYFTFYTAKNGLLKVQVTTATTFLLN